jgi:hypothetical protein
MTSRSRLLALLALGAAGAPGGLVVPARLFAQVAGIPVRNAGIGTGIGIAGDIGFPNGDAGKGTAFGATGVVGFGPLGVSASVAHWKPKGLESINSAGATLNFKVFGGPLIPLSVTLQGGGAYYGVNTTGGGRIRHFHLPVGVGVALTIPNPVFSIKPWLAPRVDVNVQRETAPGTSARTDHTAKFGISGGVDLGFLVGLSLRVMYDRVMAGNGAHPSVLSLGAGFRVGK